VGKKPLLGTQCHYFSPSFGLHAQPLLDAFKSLGMKGADKKDSLKETENKQMLMELSHKIELEIQRCVKP
jgi:hypothetical protein